MNHRVVGVLIFVFALALFSATISVGASHLLDQQDLSAQERVLIANPLAHDPFYTPKPTTDDQRVKSTVEKGLKFLVSIQNPDGSWSNDVGQKIGESYTRSEYNKPHVGVTALACMALVAGGNTPLKGKYWDKVQKGVNFILSCRQRSGQISDYGSRMYSHAFATLFLAEIYGMTHDSRTHRALKEATDFIERNQVGAGANTGGWRYEPRQQDADMSITVCQLQALRAARNVGIAVKVKAIEDARDYVITNYQPNNGSFSYQPELRYDRTTFALASAGVVALQSSGMYESYRDRRGRVIDFHKSMRYIASMRPDKFKQFPVRSCRYGFWYGHYYAAQAFHQYKNVNSKMWDDWNNHNRVHFLEMQRPNGAWVDEIGTYDEKKNAFATAMACLILSISNGYLPIFQA